MAFVEFQNVGKTYHMGEVDINALHDTTFEIEKRLSGCRWQIHCKGDL